MSISSHCNFLLAYLTLEWACAEDKIIQYSYLQNYTTQLFQLFTNQCSTSILGGQNVFKGSYEKQLTHAKNPDRESILGFYSCLLSLNKVHSNIEYKVT